MDLAIHVAAVLSVAIINMLIALLVVWLFNRAGKNDWGVSYLDAALMGITMAILADLPFLVAVAIGVVVAAMYLKEKEK